MGVAAEVSTTQFWGQVMKNILPVYLVPVSGYFGTCGFVTVICFFK